MRARGHSGPLRMLMYKHGMSAKGACQTRTGVKATARPMKLHGLYGIYEPPHEKTNNLHLRNKMRKSASQ